MIRNFIITLLIGAVASWFVVGMFAKRSESTSQEGKSIPERISLLGHTSAPKSDAPHIQFLKQFGDISSMIADIDSASPAQLKRWLMSQIDSPEASSETMQLIVTRLASMDPEAAFVFMKEHEELRPYYAIALAEWSKSDLTSAMNACFAVDPGGRIVRDVMQELNHETCESIYQDLLDRGFDEASPYVFATTFFKLGRHDPQKAAERALEFSLRSEGQDRAEIGISGVINGWYRRDPEAAYQWVMDQEDPSSKKVAIGVLASAIAKGDGVAGIDRVWDLLDVSQRRQLMGDIDNFVNEDIDTIIEWANANVESPQEHRALLNRFLDRVRLGMSGAENPEEMVKLLSYWEADTSASMLVSNVKQIRVRLIT